MLRTLHKMLWIVTFSKKEPIIIQWNNKKGYQLLTTLGDIGNCLKVSVSFEIQQKILKSSKRVNKVLPVSVWGSLKIYTPDKLKKLTVYSAIKTFYITLIISCGKEFSPIISWINLYFLFLWFCTLSRLFFYFNIFMAYIVKIRQPSKWLVTV